MMASPWIPPLVRLPLIQNWSCHNCGGCCRKHLIEITEEDRQRILAQNWAPADGIAAGEWTTGLARRARHGTSRIDSPIARTGHACSWTNRDFAGSMPNSAKRRSHFRAESIPMRCIPAGRKLRSACVSVVPRSWPTAEAGEGADRAT